MSYWTRKCFCFLSCYYLMVANFTKVVSFCSEFFHMSGLVLSVSWTQFQWILDISMIIIAAFIEAYCAKGYIDSCCELNNAPPLQRRPWPNPQKLDYGTLSGKRNFPEVIKLNILKWADAVTRVLYFILFFCTEPFHNLYFCCLIRFYFHLDSLLFIGAWRYDLFFVFPSEPWMKRKLSSGRDCQIKVHNMVKWCSVSSKKN